MTDYVPFAPNEITIDAPITVSIGVRLRDNPVAMFEGAPGAPRLADAALNPTLGAVDAIGILWVGRRAAAAAWNAVGSTVTAVIDNINVVGTTPVAPGEVVAGGILRATNSLGATSTYTLPGSWACVGFIPNRNQTGDTARTSTWKRVS